MKLGIIQAAFLVLSLPLTGFSADAAPPPPGFTLEDLRRVRRFGCSECYKTFHDELSTILRGMHKGTSHIGKVPKGLMEQQVLDQRLEDLRSRLEQAVAAENYEEAAGLRDEIRRIEIHAGIPG